MDYETLRFEEDGQVAVVTLLVSRKDGNEITQLSAELSECCQRIGTNAETRVLVIAGEKAETFSTEKAMSHMAKGSGESISVAKPVADLDRPIITGIEGEAIGQALELMLACDIRIAADTAHFGFPHIKEGFIPYDGGTQRLSRVIGQAKAMEMILTGELIDAQEAHRFGLISKVVPPEKLMPVTMGMALEMASKGPIALRYAKEAVHKGMDLTLVQGLRLEADLYFLLHTTKDRTEGIKAFLEKRRPEFEGR